MSFDELMKSYETKASEAKAANLKRYGETMAIFDEIIARYSPGGAFEKRALGQLEKQKVRDVGGETQQLISSGLYGTTTMGGTGRRWEESVGAPQRLALEDIQMQRLSQAQLGKAEGITAREDVGPDPSLYAGLMQGAASRPGIVSAGAAPSGPSGLDAFGRPLPGTSAAVENAYKQWQMSGGGSGTGGGPTSGGAYTSGMTSGTGTAPPPTGGVNIPMGTTGGAYYGAAYTGGKEGGETMEDMMKRWEDAKSTGSGGGKTGPKGEKTYLDKKTGKYFYLGPGSSLIPNKIYVS